MSRLVSSFITRVGRLLPKGYGDAGRQLGLFVLADLCYETVRGIAEGREEVAFANAGLIVDLERATGTFFEPHLQGWLLSERWLVDVTTWMYMNSHFVITTAFLVWLYLFRNDRFYFVRNMFLVAMGLALVGYALMPTAPPRLLPELGFVDTVSAYSDVGHDSALAKLFVNPYAAMPSMHIAFALMIAGAGIGLARRAWSKAFWACYPLLILFVVVVTANHFWLDAAAGAMVAAVSALVAHRLLAAARPAAWSWKPAAGQARA
jgi:membrane-associated phospholipid phosphatase